MRPRDLGLKPPYDLRVNPPFSSISASLVARKRGRLERLYQPPVLARGRERRKGRDRRVEICSFSSWELYTRVDPFGQIAATNFKKNMSFPPHPFAVTSTLDNVLLSLTLPGFAVAPSYRDERWWEKYLNVDQPRETVSLNCQSVPDVGITTHRRGPGPSLFLPFATK